MCRMWTPAKAVETVNEFSAFLFITEPPATCTFYLHFVENECRYFILINDESVTNNFDASSIQMRSLIANC